MLFIFIRISIAVTHIHINITAIALSPSILISSMTRFGDKTGGEQRVVAAMCAKCSFRLIKKSTVTVFVCLFVRLARYTYFVRCFCAFVICILFLNPHQHSTEIVEHNVHCPILFEFDVGRMGYAAAGCERKLNG